MENFFTKLFGINQKRKPEVIFEKITNNDCIEKSTDEIDEGLITENTIKTGYTNNWAILVESLLNVKKIRYENNVDVNNNEQIPRISDYKLTDASNIIEVPCKMDLYDGLDITEKDNIFVNIAPNTRVMPTVLLVNGEDDSVGFFNIISCIENGEHKNYLTSNSKNIRFENHRSTHYYFVFSSSPEYATLYKVPIQIVFQNTKTTNSHLCIDFGTSNTAVGCYLDDNYVDNISNLSINNKTILLNSENITTFLEKDRINEKDRYDSISWKKIVPTIIYIVDCSDAKNIQYAFGYEASKLLKDQNYCPEASCFLEVKRWTSNIDEIEVIQDLYGNRASIKRRNIISEFLRYVIKESENQYKCRFKNIHISTPVKLKDKVLDLYIEILQQYGYVVEKANAIDEGIAVLYSLLNNQIKNGNYENGEKEKALIIDCGGGTSDLASCEYTINKDDDGIINLTVNSEYMNGDINFGGNNLTFRIMQYMKIAYACVMQKKKRPNIDELINIDTYALFSFIEGEFENDDDDKVNERFDEVYRNLEDAYKDAEKIIPTRYSEYENTLKETYDKVKNNFYFLWKLAEEMKKEFYRSTSISRYTFNADDQCLNDIDLHINKIEHWRLSIKSETGNLEEQPYPNITFTAKEIDKLLRPDIYFLIRKFLNNLYMDKTLDSFTQIKLSGQSSKINIFMESLKEFLPGKKIKSGRINSKDKEAVELKLLCLKGAIMYLHALEMSNIEVSLNCINKTIPISVYIRTQNDEYAQMIKQGSDWNQTAKRGRITSAAKVVYMFLRNGDKNVCEPYKFVCEDINYSESSFEEIKQLSHDRILQDDIDNLPANKKYFFVYLNDDNWGFSILPLYRDENGKLYKGKDDFCSFEMNALQESFFNGKR